MPAAAVIPAPIAYIKVVVVKKLVVGFRRVLVGLNCFNTDWLAGMFLLLRREAFAAVGGFDERFHMYCEDADLCLRLQLAGWRVRLVEDVAVVHAAQRASRRSWQHLRWHLTSLLRHWFSLGKLMAKSQQHT